MTTPTSSWRTSPGRPSWGRGSKQLIQECCCVVLSPPCHRGMDRNTYWADLVKPRSLVAPSRGVDRNVEGNAREIHLSGSPRHGGVDRNTTFILHLIPGMPSPFAGEDRNFTLSIRAAKTAGSPLRGRGSKPVERVPHRYGHQLPLHGAWIETFLRPPVMASPASSAFHGARIETWCSTCMGRNGPCRSPLHGAWIETSIPRLRATVDVVASSRGRGSKHQRRP
jgi:hypothetical protein